MRAPYNQALSILRERHRPEFTAILDGLVADTGRCRGDLHTTAMSRLRLKHPDEYRGLVDECKTEAQWRPISLTKRISMPARRSDMDPSDALILFERGMTLAQMAAHDNCSQTAALKALLPQLLECQPRSRAWFERSPKPPSALELAKMLKTSQQFVDRMLRAA